MPADPTAFYASSHASASSSSLVDQLSDHESYSSSFEPSRDGSFSGASSGRSGPGPSSSSQGFLCPNCGKTFARDDLLRRHLAREARALAQPSFDRQKSCYECARSKARCDLEVPTCGRCRARGKQCQYAPRSGNPNVRKARNTVATPGMDTQMQGMTPQMATPMASTLPDQHWSMANPGFHMAPNVFMAPNPGYVKREGEPDYDSQSEGEAQSWHDPGSSASGSAFGSPRSQHSTAEHPDSAPPNLTHFSISGHPFPSNTPLPRTDSPHSFNDLESDAAPGPQRMPSRKSSGFSRTNTGPIVTNMNRSGMAFANEEGEETPIVRLSQHQLTHADSDPSRMLINDHFLAAPQHRHRATSLPEALEETLPDNVQTPWNERSMAGQPSRQLPHNSMAAANAMMPPPRPPTLITSNLNNRNAWPYPSPIRSGLYQPGLDLSGWLAEPVVPSPLYRMGPSLHSAISGNFAAISHSPVVDTPISAKFAASLAQTMGLSINPGFLPAFQEHPATAGPSHSSTHPLSRSLSDATTPPRSRYDCDGQPVLPAPQLPSAKQWWIQPDQNGEVAASIAQGSAAHFVSYPALMVLTDPTSPIPPFIHRKWLQENRARVPESLASARSILAGYYVRLPASQGFVWRLISEQIRSILHSEAELKKPDSDPVAVFGAVASLWMYLVLIVFTDESAITDHVDAGLLDHALSVLSSLSQSLLAHTVEACNAASGTMTPSLATFGWIETMIRTLFASYSLLVLQRFRENGGDARERLAGCSLILDIPLPAGAGEFEADNEADWLQAHHANQNVLTEAAAPFVRPTLRQLVQFRKDTFAAESQSSQAEAKLRDLPWAATLFDNQDEFTNVVLSVAFALDDTRV
ncbi:Zn(2)-C6 fungal-type DNA-binding domain protein [Kalmanozyma brasiliensis GHG001]|uniref:Zn(2)-C6 fungal-type domain-containing protein n=1 Tax=Kalmanozyma brasiliensis (strain GHG001) TaxID=1365824 RepID=V5EUH9_KALBG|nr:Zn(2)-C6 fungal-type DNA-binding domain protein [Kalmanozyma brasiliensis GHG001]EST05779.1 Zn(2)-C6 fungal-type DNA-binding domain protein [Kalmanozyma brasiliensis GHG001]